MKLAVTYENGTVFQHFGHTEAFKIYQIENGAVVSSQIVPTNGSGHGALAGFLQERGVNALICGGIGGGAKMALADAGIALYGGVAGEADQAVKDFLAGKLDYNPGVECQHHHQGEEHSCGSHADHECHHGNCHS